MKIFFLKCVVLSVHFKSETRHVKNIYLPLIMCCNHKKWPQLYIAEFFFLLYSCGAICFHQVKTLLSQGVWFMWAYTGGKNVARPCWCILSWFQAFVHKKKMDFSIYETNMNEHSICEKNITKNAFIKLLDKYSWLSYVFLCQNMFLHCESLYSLPSIFEFHCCIFYISFSFLSIYSYTNMVQHCACIIAFSFNFCRFWIHVLVYVNWSF